MNIALENTEEYVDGRLKNRYGDTFIRGNNGKIVYVIFDSSPTDAIPQYCISVLKSLRTHDNKKNVWKGSYMGFMRSTSMKGSHVLLERLFRCGQLL